MKKVEKCEQVEQVTEIKYELPLAEDSETSDLFKKNQYVILRDFLDLKDVKRMASRMQLLKDNNVLKPDPQAPMSTGIYGDPIQSEFQITYQKKLEEAINLRLFPTYTFSRIYAPKEVLNYHKDRPSCEISFTTTLDFDTFDDEPWNIWVEAEKSNKDAKKCDVIERYNQDPKTVYGIPYKLYLGDILVYRGCDLSHWRTKFIGVSQTQAFLHYIDANGPYIEYKYDGRPSIGSSERVRRIEPERF